MRRPSPRNLTTLNLPTGRAVDIPPSDAIAAFLKRHSPLVDDPDDDRPLSSLWTVLAWCTGAAAVCLGIGVALRRIDRGRR